MKCQNCGENDANVKYTQIINGVKKQFNLCDECAEKLGIRNMNFGMPMAFSGILDDMLDMYNGSLSIFKRPDILSIEIPRMVNNEGFFLNEGRLKNDNKDETSNDKYDENDFNRIWGINKKNEEKQNLKSESKLEMLQKRLQQEIKEERYEDAAKTRDEIKKINNI